MTASRWLVVASLIVGCKPRVPLSEVPITGGTKEQRDAARAELLDFEGWVGAERVRLAEVRFEDLPKEGQGLWDERRARVTLDEEVADLGRTLRHELCHALDSAEDLSEGRPALKSLGAPYTAADVTSAKQEAWMESFAEVCELGPVAAAIAQASSCVDDHEELLQALGYTIQEVWIGQPMPPALLVGDTLGGFEFDQLLGTVESYTVLPTTDPEFLHLVISLDAGVTEIQVDAQTGEQAPRTIEPVERVLEPPSGLAGVPSKVLKRVGWPEGPGAAVVEYVIPEHPPLSPRLAMHDGTEWRPVAKICPWEKGVDVDLFTAQGQVWYAWDEDDILHWVPLLD